MTNRRYNSLTLMVLAALVFCATLLSNSQRAWSQEPGWEAKWNQLVVAAKQEGKIVFAAAPDPLMRKQIPERFHARFGIRVEYLAGRSSDLATKLQFERSSGIYSVDAITAGVQSMSGSFYRDKLIDPLKPALILPEVTDRSKWKSGKPWFIDPEEQYILRLFNSASSIFFINTRFVPLAEVKSVRDLLNPKWRGKISVFDPTDAGTGSNTAAALYVQFGEEFVKNLLVDQKPVFSRDKRQMEDWLARGTYPISFGARGDEVERLRQEGFPIVKPVLPDLMDTVGAASGLLALANRAPHPNAAKVFLNWLASREGAEVFSRTQLHATMRNDVDESFLPAEVIPRPGVKYFDTYDWEFTNTTKEKVRLLLKKILKG